MFPWSESVLERLKDVDNASESAERHWSYMSDDRNVLYAFVRGACVFHAEGSYVDLC